MVKRKEKLYSMLASTKVKLRASNALGKRQSSTWNTRIAKAQK